MTAPWAARSAAQESVAGRHGTAQRVPDRTGRRIELRTELSTELSTNLALDPA